MFGKHSGRVVYEIMHKDRIAATIDETGHCRIYDSSFLPYGLYLEEAQDVDGLVNNVTLVRDLATNGCFPKAWQRAVGGFRLLKDGGDHAVDRELLASRICRCFDSMEAFEIFCHNHDWDTEACVLWLDRHNYYMMNIVDYIVGNTDRHWGNWGVLVDNADNRPVCLHKLMDFNQAFHAYDLPDGAGCQTVFGRRMTQKEAAAEAVRHIGLNQTGEIKKEWFFRLPQFYDMFVRRLDILMEIQAGFDLGRSKGEQPV